jgi:hypothetical protein
METVRAHGVKEALRVRDAPFGGDEVEFDD